MIYQERMVPAYYWLVDIWYDVTDPAGGIGHIEDRMLCFVNDTWRLALDRYMAENPDVARRAITGVSIKKVENYT